MRPASATLPTAPPQEQPPAPPCFPETSPSGGGSRETRAAVSAPTPGKPPNHPAYRKAPKPAAHPLSPKQAPDAARFEQKTGTPTPPTTTNPTTRKDSRTGSRLSRYLRANVPTTNAHKPQHHPPERPRTPRPTTRNQPVEAPSAKPPTPTQPAQATTVTTSPAYPRPPATHQCATHPLPTPLQTQATPTERHHPRDPAATGSHDSQSRKANTARPAPQPPTAAPHRHNETPATGKERKKGEDSPRTGTTESHHHLARRHQRIRSTKPTYRVNLPVGAMLAWRTARHSPCKDWVLATPPFSPH